MIESIKYPGYLADMNGNIYSKKSGNIKLIKQNKNKYGYLYFSASLGKRGVSKNTLSHRFIADIFLDNELKKPVVNHKNGNKIDNRVINLEWCTHKENINHAISIGLIKKESLVARGKKYAKRISRIDIKSGEVLDTWETSKEPGRKLGNKFNSSAILRCCKLEKDTHKGYRWRFVGEEEKQYIGIVRKKNIIKCLCNNEVILEGTAEEISDKFRVSKNSVYRSLNEQRKFKGKYRLERGNN